MTGGTNRRGGCADRRQPLSPEHEERLIEALVCTLESSPAGDKIESSQLTAIIRANLSTMCSGRTVAVDPVTDQLLEIPGVKAVELIRPMARFKAYLKHLQLDLHEPTFGLSLDVRASAMRSGPVETDLIELFPIEATPTAVETRPAEPIRLPRQPFGKSRWPAALLALILLIAGSGWAVRGGDTVDDTGYRALFPLTEVQILDGRWIGQLDEPRWSAMGDVERELAVERLRGRLDAEGRLLPNGVMVVDAEGRSLLAVGQNKHLHATRGLMDLGRE